MLVQARELEARDVLLAPAVFLDDVEAWGFHALVRGEAMLAAWVQTLATAAYHGLVIA